MDERTAAELDRLLGRLCDGVLADEEAARLQALLADEAAQERYAEYVLLHEALRAELSPGGTLPLGMAARRPAVAAPSRPRRWRRWGLAGAGVGLGAALAAAAFLLSPAPRDRVERQGVAVVTRTAGARWAAGGLPVEVGAPLPAGKLVLAAGLVQLDLYSGATIVLEGPAAIDLVDERSARFHHGRIRTRVPEPAKGLKISLPGGDVVDLGTEFAIDLGREGAAEIHVFDGAVEWHRGGTVTRLDEGQGLRLARGADQPIPADEGAFADPGRLASAAVADVERLRRTWSEYRERLIADPTVLLYLDFQDAGPWGRAARNHAAPAWGAPDGAIVGCRWVPGRFPDKRALEFKRPSDRVLVNVPGEHEAFSIAAWVRFDGLDNLYNAFVHTDGWVRGGVHTHIQPSGVIVLDLHSRERLASSRRIGRADLGRWIHLAWVYDQTAGRASFYMDGRLDASMPITSSGPVTFGSAQIGNWDRQHRNLNGQLDEFVILGRALAAEEIALMASAGRP